ncbi:MAG: amino acid ABC transporter permease [Hyphomicrobiales bacterium]
MAYVFQFGIVADHADELIAGAIATLRLSVIAMVLGLAVAAICAFLRAAGPWPLRHGVGLYVEVIRNTPFLVQLFVIYFSLPAIGIRFDPDIAAIIGMSINFGGYATEILRAGVEAVPRGQIEAGRALGLTRLRIFMLIIAYPAVKTVYPALASQFVILLLGSSVISTISAFELTGVTNSLQSQTFRAFEFYFVGAAIYLALALAVKAVLRGIYWFCFERGRAA